MEEEDVVVQHMRSIVQSHAQFKLRLFHTSVIIFEKKLLSFSALAIDSNMICRHTCDCESSLVPAPKLRQVVNVDQHSEVMKLATSRTTCELSSVSIRKKFYV